MILIGRSHDVSRPELKEARPARFKRIQTLFNALEIRFKFLISFALIFFLSMLFCNLFIYVYVRNNIEARIESELANTSQIIYDMVNISVTVSIKNHLRAVAEKNLEIVKSLYEKYEKGLITEAEAKNRAADMVLSQTIGSSGYLYCLDSTGLVLVHPSSALIGTNVADFEFVEHMTEFRQGYHPVKGPRKTGPAYRRPGEAENRTGPT